MKIALFNLLLSTGIFATLLYGCAPCRYETATGVVTIKTIAADNQIVPVVLTNSNKAQKTLPNKKPANEANNNFNKIEFMTVVFDLTIDQEFEKNPSKQNREKEKIRVTRQQMENLNMAVGKQFKVNYRRMTTGTCSPPGEPFSVTNWQPIEK